MDLSSKVLLSQEMICLQKRKLCTHKYKRAKTVKFIRCGHPSLKLQNRPCHRGISIKQVGLWKQEGGGRGGTFSVWKRLLVCMVFSLFGVDLVKVSFYLSTFVQVKSNIPRSFFISCFVHFFHFVDKLFPRYHGK